MDKGHLLLLADLLLVAHFLVALFITWGLPVIWLGGWLGWRFVRNPWFRFIHVGLMAFVLAETVVGMLCPLTTWEAELRHAAGAPTLNGGQSFVGYWVGKLLFHDFSWQAYTIAYAAFFLAVAATFFFVPVRRKKRKKRPDHSVE